MDESTQLQRPPATGDAPKTGERRDHTVEGLTPEARHIWNHVSHSSLGNLWNFEGASPWAILKRSGKAFMDDNLVSRAAELGYYFLFALFPTLVFASSIMGLAAKRASRFW